MSKAAAAVPPHRQRLAAVMGGPGSRRWRSAAKIICCTHGPASTIPERPPGDAADHTAACAACCSRFPRAFSFTHSASCQCCREPGSRVPSGSSNSVSAMIGGALYVIEQKRRILREEMKSTQLTGGRELCCSKKLSSGGGAGGWRVMAGA